MARVSAGGQSGEYLNFGSQDYLGLAQDERVEEAALGAIRDFGVHSAGSPAFIGRTRALVDIEDRLAGCLHRERCLLFPTGWAAGYGAVAGLVRPGDAIAIDALAHACLREGAARATANVVRFRHNDPADLDRALAEARALSRSHGVFVVIESLYSMDSDSPSLTDMMVVARRHGANVIIDIAHDFGAMGREGLGLLRGHLVGDLAPDVVMGSFSKTFAANGGFIATAGAVAQYLSYYASPLLFSNAMSPVQAAVIGKCLDIVFSSEGERLREALMVRIDLARECVGQRQDVDAVGDGLPRAPRQRQRAPARSGRDTARRSRAGVVATRSHRVRVPVRAPAGDADGDRERDARSRARRLAEAPGAGGRGVRDRSRRSRGQGEPAE
jgi:7-keto-8-aminopelargonate synthetase-like enzyme